MTNLMTQQSAPGSTKHHLAKSTFAFLTRQRLAIRSHYNWRALERWIIVTSCRGLSVRALLRVR